MCLPLCVSPPMCVSLYRGLLLYSPLSFSIMRLRKIVVGVRDERAAMQKADPKVGLCFNELGLLPAWRRLCSAALGGFHECRESVETSADLEELISHVSCDDLQRGGDFIIASIAQE
jgi:hypothetical protein